MNSLFRYLRQHWMLTLIIVLIVLYTVNNSPSAAYDFAGDANEERAAISSLASFVAEPLNENSPQDYEQKIIRSGSLDLHVDDVIESSEDIASLIEGMDGRVTYSNIGRYSSSYYGNLTVQVPSEKFDEAMTAMKKLSLYVDSESTNADDVTAAYKDLDVRLANAQAEEAQYLSILTSAGEMSEVLEVTRAISEVRYTIESLQSQLSNYDSQIDYSVISVNLSEDDSVRAVTATWRPLSTFTDAFSDWVVFLQEGVDKLIYLLIFGWPILLLWLVWRRWKR